MQAGPVPRFNNHADAACCEVGAAVHPVGVSLRVLGGSPHMFLQQLWLLDFEVVRTVFETEKVTCRHLTRRSRCGAPKP